ncbi:MAG TPA: MBL fold metallo-hydrolase [Flavisolibacter sp.]|nr:MBL fold metallo-hydrolase [Flavisolibacter sp.]
MPVEICAIASGSNGNCYYVGNENEAVLVDAGISCKETEFRMRRSGLSLEKVKAVFVSHEHTDHISGLPLLAKKYKLPIFISEPTLKGSRLWFEKSCLNHFSANEEVVIGDLTVNPFTKLHDAADPYSFTITSGGVTIGVITDIGAACNNVIHHFSKCHAAFLESNYDEKMLDKGRYPVYLKNRIRNGQGHISNRQALELFTKHRSSSLTHLFLSHLSHNNNCPKLVEELFTTNAGGVQMVVTSRTKETAVYKIGLLSRMNTNNYDAFVQQPQLAFSFS